MLSIQHTKDVKLPIQDTSGVQDVISIQRTGKVNSVQITTDLKHKRSEDLKITLRAPSGKEVVVHNRTKSKKPFANNTFGAEQFSFLQGESINGDWSLQVVDFAKNEEGYFDKWSLDLTANDTEQPVVANIPDSNPKGHTSMCEYNHEGILEALECSVNIKHKHAEDLTLTLISPSGKKAVLQSRQDGHQQNLKATFKNDTTKIFVGENLKGTWKLQVNDHSARDSGAIHSWKLNAKIGPGAPDDLTKIEGIGPKISQLFQAAGLRTYTDVANASTDRMKSILNAAGPRFKTHNPGTWAQQSAMAAAGDWQNLKKWQDELDGGK